MESLHSDKYEVCNNNSLYGDVYGVLQELIQIVVLVGSPVDDLVLLHLKTLADWSVSPIPFRYAIVMYGTDFSQCPQTTSQSTRISQHQ